MAQVFLSPGVYTQEQDFSAYASTIGITKLGLVGLTDKGPAFKVIPVSTSDQFLATFGGTDVNLALPYVANAFLAQSNQLNIVRVLGEEGYTNSNAWTVTSQAAPITVIPETLAIASTSFSAVSAGTVVTAIFSGITPIGNYTTTVGGNLTALTNAINSGGTQFYAFTTGSSVFVLAAPGLGASANGASLTFLTSGGTGTSPAPPGRWRRSASPPRHGSTVG